jgi:IS30 family transposase
MAKNITFEERYTLDRMLRSKYSIPRIASCLGRSYKTVRREINRCHKDSYSADIAQINASKKMARKQAFALTEESENYIIENLTENKWSPMIISKRLMSEGLQCVSHTYLYGYIKKDKESGGKLYKHLAHPDKYRNRKEYKGSIPNRTSIDKRPEAANDRERIGDIEVDLIVSPKNQGSSIVSSVDRKSRYCVLDKVAQKTKELVSDVVINGLSNIGFNIETLTSDNGTEFTDHEYIAKSLNSDYYFADPYSSYQRGSIEQLNGLVRRFIPKGTFIDDVDNSSLKNVEEKLNNRPREVLEWLSPVEYLAKQGIKTESGRLRV